MKGKRTMFCRKCGAQNADGAKFCEKCGAKIMQPVPSVNSGNASQSGGSQKKKKKGNKILVIVLILVLIAAIAAGVLIAMQKKKEKEYNAKIARAEKYIEDLDYEKAEAAYLAAIDIDPKQEEPYLKLADIYVAQGQPKKAKEILAQGAETTHSETIEKESSYYTYVYDQLMEEEGRSKTGIYELSYEKYNDYARLVPGEDISGLVNYRIMDFDHDGENEVFTVEIESEKDSNNSGYVINEVYLRMYENVDGTFQKSAEYHPDGTVLGSGDYESDGVFLKTADDEIYICGGLRNTVYIMADGSSFVSFVLTYDGEDFRFYTGLEERAAGSSFEDYIDEAAEMAKKLENIGLPKAAAAVRESYMLCMTFEDEADAVLFRIEGKNNGGSYSDYRNSGNISDMGKVILKYWVDTLQPPEDLKTVNASDSEKDTDEDTESSGFTLTVKMTKEEKESLREEIDALAKETDEAENSSGSMLEIKQTAGEALEKWEALMDKVYQAAAEHLSDKKQEELAAEQAAWLEKRDADAEEAAAEYAGGTLEGLELVTVKYSLTEERCYALLDWIETE